MTDIKYAMVHQMNCCNTIESRFIVYAIGELFYNALQICCCYKSIKYLFLEMA